VPTVWARSRPVASIDVVDQVPSRQAVASSRPILTTLSPPPIDVGTAAVTFVASWFAAQLLAQIVLGVTGYGDGVDDAPIRVIAVSLVAAWSAYVVGAWSASTRGGSGDMVVDYAIVFRPVDAIGIGIGVLSQLVLVGLVYLPLEQLWPDTFSEGKLSENAQGLVDRADGASMVLLMLLVVVGAPVVEEIVYRGLLQRSFVARYNDGPDILDSGDFCKSCTRSAGGRTGRIAPDARPVRQYGRK
jgi:membrane protease YdiL (CAAX protease family)